MSLSCSVGGFSKVVLGASERLSRRKLRQGIGVVTSARRVVLWVLILALGAGAAGALSIFDVIQLSKKGYTDDEIVALIESTDSLFELQAEDLPRLKQLGVSEPVIRAMLERVPAETTGATPVGGPPVAEATDEHEHSGDEHSGEAPAAGIISPGLEAAQPAAPSAGAYEPLVSFYPVEEERAGAHPHMALTLSGLEVLILRDEGAFPSMQARAIEVTQRLDAAWTQGDGAFYAVSAARGPTVVFQGAVTRQRITVLEVSDSDAHSYELRSGREVSRDLLAAYWADLLSDFGAIAMARAPSRTLALHDGDALGVLYEALISSAGSGGGLVAAAELLPSSLRFHLGHLAVAIPIDYEGTRLIN